MTWQQDDKEFAQAINDGKKSSIVTPQPIRWIWKSKCVPGIKFFAWLLLNDRLNTRNILRRKKFLQEGYNCVLCQDSVEETVEHLFFDCPAAVSRWFALGITWADSVDIYQKLIIAREAFPHSFFMEIFMISAHCIWVERNAFIFEAKAPSLSSWKAAFKREVIIHLYRIKPSLHSSVRAWLQSL